MKLLPRALGALIVVAPLWGGPALGHVTLETAEAQVGTAYKAVFRVPHGCEGAATVGIRVKVPEGLIDARPMPKPGWTLELVKGPYAQAYTLHGSEITEGVTEVHWSGGTLPDAFYDEFTLRGTLAADLPVDQVLYFPVVQECETGTDRWIEIPGPGESAGDYEMPAPGVMLRARD